MPPILIALVTIAAYFFVPKKQRIAQGDVVVTPQNTPVGITSGFSGAPLPVSQAPLPASPQQVNRPGTSASGLPGTSVAARNSTPAVTQPSNLPPQEEFYTNLPSVLKPRFNPTPVPTRNKPSGDCGCGGHGSTPSQCSVAVNRYANSGCLAPSQASLITPQSMPFLDKWMANLQSSPDASIFGAYQDVVRTIQNQAPQTEDQTPPVGSTEPHVGLSYRRPVRASL